MKVLFKKYEKFLNWSLGSFNVAAFALILFFKKDSSDDCCLLGAIGSLFLPFVIVAVMLVAAFMFWRFVFKTGKKLQNESVERDLAKERHLRNIEEELKKKNEGNKNSNVTEEIEKLFQMKEKGIITEEDYKAMKEKIIKEN